MAYSNSSNSSDEHINRLRQMMARDSSIKQRIQSQIDRDAIDDYRDSYQAPKPSPNTSYSSKFRDADLKIDVLTEENKALKEKYAELLKKTMLIIEKYKTVLAENEKFKIKKDKRESWENNISNLKKYMKDILEKIIVWFSS